MAVTRSFRMGKTRHVKGRCNGKTTGSREGRWRAEDLERLAESAALAGASRGHTAPHPHTGCVLVSGDGRVLAQTHQRGQGTLSAPAEAIAAAREAARGATAYLNLEPCVCAGDRTQVEELVTGGVKRVVLGMRHPLECAREGAIEELQRAGVHVDVLEDLLDVAEEGSPEVQTLSACLHVNEDLLHLAATGKPMSTLKYAMTMDGKIATTKMHAAWVTAPEARGLVFQERALSDAVIVGGNTVRRDDPQLTTRQEGGHHPVRIVMSRTLALPEDAKLWNVSQAPTVVMTQRGARSQFQQRLRSMGVQVVEFDFLNPLSVADYCVERGFLRVLWECGGTLAAPAIASGVIHKTMAFVAPKIIGGSGAPTPCGDLGYVEMTQALPVDVSGVQQVGPDILISGYLPSSGGVRTLARRIAKSSGQQHAKSKDRTVSFYKAWNLNGYLSNFSPHSITLPMDNGEPVSWLTVEHFYQASKFLGVENSEARETVQRIKDAPSPEEAARIGRRAEVLHPELVIPNWDKTKLEVMHKAVKAKFSSHENIRELLLGITGEIVEASPHDFFWGCGYDKTGSNHLGEVLQAVRQELLEERNVIKQGGENQGVGCI